MRIFGWLEIDAGRSEPRPYKRLEAAKGGFQIKSPPVSEWLTCRRANLMIEVALCRKS
jgi:hypothetical protein